MINSISTWSTFTAWPNTPVGSIAQKCWPEYQPQETVSLAINLSLTLTTSLIARFMGPTWGPSGADRTQMGPMLAHELWCLGYHRYATVKVPVNSTSLYEKNYLYIKMLHLLSQESHALFLPEETKCASQIINQKINGYLNLVEKIIKN